MKKILQTLALTTILATPTQVFASDITELEEGHHHGGAPKAAFHLPTRDEFKQDVKDFAHKLHQLILKIAELFQNNPDLLTEIADFFPNTKEFNAVKGLLQTADPELKKALKLYQKASDPSTRVAALKELTSTATDIFLKKLPAISGQYAWLNNYLDKDALQIFQDDMWKIWQNNNQHTSKLLEAFGKETVNLFIKQSVPAVKDMLASHNNLFSNDDYSQIWALFKGVSSHTHNFKGIISTIEGIAQQKLEALATAPAVVEAPVAELVVEAPAAAEPAAEVVATPVADEPAVVEVAAETPVADEVADEVVATPVAAEPVAEPAEATPVVEAPAETPAPTEAQ